MERERERKRVKKRDRYREKREWEGEREGDQEGVCLGWRRERKGEVVREMSVGIKCVKVYDGLILKERESVCVCVSEYLCGLCSVCVCVCVCGVCVEVQVCPIFLWPV